MIGRLHKLHSKIAATTDASTEVKVTDDEEERKSSSSNDESDDPALQRLAILFVIMHEPVQLVTDIHRATVNCTCGETTRMLLPCRHVIAVNMKVKKQRFDANQIVPRWRRDYMINPTTKQPLKVKVQRWQPEDVQNEMRVVASNSNASVDSRGLEEKVDSLLTRVRVIALKSAQLFSQLATIVQPWINATLASNPSWSELVKDPSIKYGRQTSNKRIRSNGEDDASARNTRSATPSEIASYISQQNVPSSQSVAMNPTQGFDERTRS
jgi:hypothetical protein